MATVCSTKQVEGRLHEWGLGEVVVKNMGGRCFLLEISDQELFNLLEERDWSLLKEVFSEVDRWSESFHLPERITWVQAYGIPLHCWNYTTFKRVAEAFGYLLALGENATCCGDRDKVNILISTNQIRRIEEVIELEVGRDIFMVRLEEMGLNDQYVRSQNQGGISAPRSKIGSKSGDSSSVSCSEPYRNEYQATKDNNTRVVEDEAIMTMSMENRFNNGASINDINDSRHVGETDILGSSSNDRRTGLGVEENALTKDIPNGKDLDSFNTNRIDITGPDWARIVELGSNAGGKVVRNGEKISTNDQVLDDMLSMGFNKQDLNQVNPEEEDLVRDIMGDQMDTRPLGDVSWADSVDILNNYSVLGSGKDKKAERGANAEEDNVPSNGPSISFPELQSKFSPLKQKRYGSLKYFQDKALTSQEKKKRDRAQRRCKKKRNVLEDSEIDGRSLSDSDMHARREMLTKEARKTLAFGKKLGMQIIGSEEEAIQELVALEEAELRDKEA
ncbi:hypothetical protein GQ457_07G015910 [Hibiscus cannabinus]